MAQQPQAGEARKSLGRNANRVCVRDRGLYNG
jgi:hypothetical protein